jgi:hypothetical protein
LLVRIPADSRLVVDASPVRPTLSSSRQDPESWAVSNDLPKSRSDSPVSDGVYPKWVPKNLCAVDWGSGKDVQWSPKVGVTLKVADWHVLFVQPSVPRGSQGVLSRGCHIRFAKFVQTQFSLT